MSTTVVFETHATSEDEQAGELNGAPRAVVHGVALEQRVTEDFVWRPGWAYRAG